jgi:hypothetical protein
MRTHLEGVKALAVVRDVAAQRQAVGGRRARAPAALHQPRQRLQQRGLARARRAQQQSQAPRLEHA